MSVVIVGGNDCMVCQYKNICKKYSYKAKVFYTGSERFQIENRLAGPGCIVYEHR